MGTHPMHNNLARKFAKVDRLKEKLRAAEADLDREISVYAKSRGCAFMRPEAVRFEIGKQ